MTLQAGDAIGGYLIEGQIGSGGMATVYKAYHERLDRRVAIKLLHAAFVQDSSFLQRFQREARIVARLEHPHIVPIYDYAELGSQPCLVMKYIRGGTLKRRLIKHGITLPETERMMTLLADALTYAHEMGVLHRDIKPSNILIDERGLPYLTDFGLARIAQVGDSTISHDMMLGTPFYISPEQAKGERELTAATDVYSFGVILYELLAGRVPFAADTPYAIVHEHIYNQPHPPSLHNPALPPAVDAVLLRALAKAPAERYQTAAALMDDFKAALAASDPHRLPPEDSALPPRATPHRRKKRKPKPQIEASGDVDGIDYNSLGQRLDRSIRQGVEYVSELADKIKKGEQQPTQEELIRRRIEKKLRARSDLIKHLIVYAVINGIMWALWLESRADFPWAIFVSGPWGIGLLSQYIEYYYRHGRGADRGEAEIEQEITRQMHRSQLRAEAEYRSLQDGDWDADGADVRLSADGELSDSFIESAQHKHKSSRR